MEQVMARLTVILEARKLSAMLKEVVLVSTYMHSI